MPARLKVRHLPVASLRPNPWNPNQMDAATMRATEEAIDRFGFVDPVTVRAHPDEAEAWQIIDGEHRWGFAQKREMETVPCVVLKLDDVAARKLTVVLNEDRGEPDAPRLGALMRELQELGDDVASALPYSDSHIDHLLDLGAADWESFDGAEPPEPPDDDAWVTITARVPRGLMRTWEDTIAAVLDREDVQLHGSRPIAAGQVLEVLAANYLAGA